MGMIGAGGGAAPGKLAARERLEECSWEQRREEMGETPSFPSSVHFPLRTRKLCPSDDERTASGDLGEDINE